MACVTFNKRWQFYQTNVDANGINHGGSEMVQNKTGHMSQQGHMNQNTHEPTATHATRSYAIIKPSNDESKANMHSSNHQMNL